MDSDGALTISRLRSERPLGLPALLVDLGSFIATAREVGTDAALLLLTVRALTLRRTGAVPVRELRWVLGVNGRAIRRWLDALEHAGLAVWHDDRGMLRLDVASTETERTLFAPDDAPGVVHRVPTIWFVRTLPLVGRRAFLVYLYLRSRERAAGFTAPLTLGMVARACGLRSARQAAWALGRLRRAGLVAVADGHGRFLISDPPPLRRWERLLLTWRASGSRLASPLGCVALETAALVAALTLGTLLYLTLRR